MKKNTTQLLCLFILQQALYIIVSFLFAFALNKLSYYALGFGNMRLAVILYLLRTYFELKIKVGEQNARQ